MAFIREKRNTINRWLGKRNRASMFVFALPRGESLLADSLPRASPSRQGERPWEIRLIVRYSLLGRREILGVEK